MKKIMMAVCALGFGLAASAECTWSWWGEHADESVRGASLGIGSVNEKISGAQISVCMSKAQKVTSGFQGAIGYSQVGEFYNGVQMAVYSNAQHAALQFGLICHNEGGFLPWFVFFNFDKTRFGAAK